MFDENLSDEGLDSYLRTVIVQEIEDHKKKPQEGVSLEELTRRLEAHHAAKTGRTKHAA